MSTPTLDLIASRGNRGHNHTENNHITCADGTTLSVIAGGGTYSIPRPALCCCSLSKALFQPWNPLSSQVEHDYPGPYTHVEVMSDDPELVEPEDGVATVAVEDVRAYIEKHGGER